MFIFTMPSLAPGQTVYARTILRTYSTFGGLVENVFYVSARELIGSKERVVESLASNALCDAPPEPTPTGGPTRTPTATPTATAVSADPLYLPLITTLGHTLP